MNLDGTLTVQRGKCRRSSLRIAPADASTLGELMGKLISIGFRCCVGAV